MITSLNTYYVALGNYFFVVALIAALFGFGGRAAGAAGIAKFLFFIFIVLFGIALVMNLTRRA